MPLAQVSESQKDKCGCKLGQVRPEDSSPGTPVAQLLERGTLLPLFLPCAILFHGPSVARGPVQADLSTGPTQVGSERWETLHGHRASGL